jgi:hypothetical protein
MFSNQQKQSGAGGLVGVAALMAAWFAVAALMVGAYSNPEIRHVPGCEIVCRTPATLDAHG